MDFFQTEQIKQFFFLNVRGRLYDKRKIRSSNEGSSHSARNKENRNESSSESFDHKGKLKQI